MKIGVHPMNLHLRLARDWPGAFAGLAPQFVDYDEGRDTGALLAAGRIDVGGTGSTPPLIAQARGLPVRYVAASAPRPANGALLVAPGSAITSAAHLVGKRVAMIDGSFHTYLLARALEQAGHALGDVTRVELSPGRSRTALLAGEVDAWVAMDPQIEPALDQGEAQLLVRCGATIPNRSVFWTLDAQGLAPAAAQDFVQALTALGAAIAAEPDRAARLLAGPSASPALLAQWQHVVAHRDWTIQPADAALVAEQQDEADTLWRHGDFAAPVVVSPLLAA